jgi:hypothetical protein
MSILAFGLLDRMIRTVIINALTHYYTFDVSVE